MAGISRQQIKELERKFRREIGDYFRLVQDVAQKKKLDDMKTSELHVALGRLQDLVNLGEECPQLGEVAQLHVEGAVERNWERGRLG